MKYLLIILLLAGCITSKKVKRYLNEHPDTSAEYCAETYPVKDSLIKGDSVVTYDTLWGIEVMHDTTEVANEVKVPIQVIKFVPQIVTKTIKITDTIIKENTARVSYLEIELGKQVSVTEKKAEQLHTMTGKRDWWRQVCLITWGICLLYIILRLKTKLPI